jgi:hypothetical protein
MPYVKPGVSVRQVQESVSPNLTTPSLFPAIIGPGYHVEEITDNANSAFTSDYESTYDAADGTTFLISGLSGYQVDGQSVYVDLICRNNANYGDVLHVASGIASTVFSVNVGSNQITLPSGLGMTWDNANIKVGYRALRSDLNSAFLIESTSDIENQIGKIDISNTLAFGVYLALLNGNTATYAFGINSLSSESTAHSSARDDLSLREVYAMCPLTMDSSIVSAYQVHANSYSDPDEKKERIVLAGRKIAWVNTSYTGTGDYYTGASAGTTNKAATANQQRNDALANAVKRSCWSFPDVAYVSERRHVSTLKTDYINEMFSGTAGGSLGLPAIFATNVTLTDGTKYYAGQEITNARWLKMASTGENSYYSAYIPVPGYFYMTAIAGMVGGLDPQQGFTNLTVTGLRGVKYSNDWFTESQLNSIASGGNFIFIQSLQNVSPILIRHQLTTDRTAVETQELSIIKSIDYCAKFIRNGLVSYIGRYNITPRFLKLLGMTLSAQAKFLKSDGIVSDMKITGVRQSSTSRDTIEVTLNILPFYPVNYITITFFFYLGRRSLKHHTLILRIFKEEVKISFLPNL